jgi:2-polyprenyl-6-methoxyphenol hydroxylase-like FAD-dependent oxidoreductase
MIFQLAKYTNDWQGQVLALALKHHKIDCEVFETRDEDYRHGGNIALAPNAIRVLDHVGVYDALQS